MQSTAKITIDINVFERLYMRGMTDGAIAREMGCSHVRLHNERVSLRWPTNHGIFGWQRRLKRSDFERIPAKYRLES